VRVGEGVGGRRPRCGLCSFAVASLASDLNAIRSLASEAKREREAGAERAAKERAELISYLLPSAEVLLENMAYLCEDAAEEWLNVISKSVESIRRALSEEDFGSAELRAESALGFMSSLFARCGGRCKP